MREEYKIWVKNLPEFMPAVAHAKQFLRRMRFKKVSVVLVSGPLSLGSVYGPYRTDVAGFGPQGQIKSFEDHMADDWNVPIVVADGLRPPHQGIAGTVTEETCFVEIVEWLNARWAELYLHATHLAVEGLVPKTDPAAAPGNLQPG
jgi:hypothetical protein